jgi:hypothetical protein
VCLVGWIYRHVQPYTSMLNLQLRLDVVNAVPDFLYRMREMSWFVETTSLDRGGWWC